MNGERAPMPGVGLLEPVDGVLGYVDYHKNLLLGTLAFKRVVRLVPRILQVDKRFSEAVDLQWKRPHHPLLPTCAPGLSVLKGTVHLMPFRAAADAGEQIRGGAGQAVEQCVEGRIVDGFAVRRSGYTRLLHKSKDPLLLRIKPGADSEEVRHSRESGNPETSVIEVDSRFRGNDGPRRPFARVAYPHWQ